MEFFSEMIREMDLRRPRVILSDDMAVLENVTGIVMISPGTVTVRHGKGFTSVEGTGLFIREIGEGRLLIGGKVERAEFYQSQSAD